MQAFQLLRLLAREQWAARTLTRTPESEEMNDPEQVKAFHAAGAQYLQGLYHFNALAISKMAPKGGTVVDLGPGPAQFLAYLATARPDLRLIGIELAERMVAQGRELLAARGLSQRVHLQVGDMTDFVKLMDERVSVVCSVFSLHHLPTLQLLARCLAEIAALRARDGTGVWVFDHARPKSAASAASFPQIFTPDAAPVFNADSTHSLIASWTLEEMSGQFQRAGLADGQHMQARLLPLYQIHRFQPIGRAPSTTAADALWAPPALSRQALKDSEGLRWLFPKLG